MLPGMLTKQGGKIFFMHSNGMNQKMKQKTSNRTKRALNAIIYKFQCIYDVSLTQ